MNDIQKAELVKYRFEKAKMTFAEVDVQLDNHFWNTAINRLYYACFYAVSALLIQKDIKAYTHTGIKQMFGLHIVLTGLIDPEISKIYNTLFDKRQKGDYEDFFYFDESSARQLVLPAKELIQQIEILLRAQL
jgi:uncharacterized protein (UPF0332 family)